MAAGSAGAQVLRLQGALVAAFLQERPATALTARHLHEAAARGCETATLQSTPMAEDVYATVGFEDLGRFLEYAPGI